MKSIRNILGRRPARGGGGVAYSRLFKPNKFPTRVRLIPGKYVHPDGETYPLHFVVQHYVPRIKKSFVCSSTWKVSDGVYEPAGKCVGCYIHNQNVTKVGEYSKLSVSRSFKYPVTVIVLEDFHLDPIGYNGKPLGTNDDGEQMYRKTLCIGEANGCDGCQRGLKKEFGRRMIWEIPETFLEALQTAADAHQDYCANCGHRGLSMEGAVCPACGEIYPFAVKAGSIVKCPSCGTRAEPVIVYHCDHCDDPRPPTIFDAVFTVSSTKEGSGYPSLTVARTDIGSLQSLGYEVPEQWLDPLDLERMYRPMSLAAQAQLIGIKNPFEGQDTFNYDGEPEKEPF